MSNYHNLTEITTSKDMSRRVQKALRFYKSITLRKTKWSLNKLWTVNRLWLVSSQYSLRKYHRLRKRWRICSVAGTSVSPLKKIRILISLLISKTPRKMSKNQILTLAICGRNLSNQNKCHFRAFRLIRLWSSRRPMLTVRATRLNHPINLRIWCFLRMMREVRQRCQQPNQ